MQWVSSQRIMLRPCIIPFDHVHLHNMLLWNTPQMEGWWCWSELPTGGKGGSQGRSLAITCIALISISLGGLSLYSCLPKKSNVEETENWLSSTNILMDCGLENIGEHIQCWQQTIVAWVVDCSFFVAYWEGIPDIRNSLSQMVVGTWYGLGHGSVNCGAREQKWIILGGLGVCGGCDSGLWALTSSIGSNTNSTIVRGILANPEWSEAEKRICGTLQSWVDLSHVKPDTLFL